MRDVPEDLQRRLDQGVTTFCRCWRLDRPAGVSIGFTDHDEPLAFDGVTFEPSSGLSASGLESAEGLAADNQDIAGALSSEALTEEDLRAGLYQSSELRNWLVDWRDPDVRLLLFRGTLGAIRRRGGAFSAEVLGLSEKLNNPIGRQLMPSCDASLGDAACGVDLSDPVFRGAGAVGRISGNGSLVVTGLDTEPPGWFSRGRLTWTSGANVGSSSRIKAHRRVGVDAELELWAAPAHTTSIGDAFDVVAGCDKRLTTCRAKFGNLANFRGFPHMPEDDWVTSYPNRSEQNDGGSLIGG